MTSLKKHTYQKYFQTRQRPLPRLSVLRFVNTTAHLVTARMTATATGIAATAAMLQAAALCAVAAVLGVIVPERSAPAMTMTAVTRDLCATAAATIMAVASPLQMANKVLLTSQLDFIHCMVIY